MWEDGLIGLDDDINEHLRFEVHHPNPAYSDMIITPRMLLTHTSSIRNYNTTDYIVCGDSPIPLGYFLENYLVPGGAYYSSSNWFWNLPPGDEYRYTSIGNSLAAYLVEVVADSFPVFCRDRIFEPLEMNETGWFFADFEDSMDIAQPYHWNGNEYVPYCHYGQPNYPGVQLRSSTLQMARFLIAIMQGGEIDGVRIMESSTVELMNTVQFPGIPGSGHPGESGLGWFRIELFDRVMWGHLGRYFGAVTGMFYCPEENTGVIVLSNEDFIWDPPFPDENMLMIYELFEFVSDVSPCDYVIGDYNGNETFNVADIIAAFSKLQTGSPDPAYVCECPYGSGDEWAVAMDVNNNCAFNIADVIAGFSMLQTGAPELVPCEDCPPPGWEPGPDRKDRPLAMPMLESKVNAIHRK